MTSTPEPADARLLAAHDLARTALAEVTPATSIGAPAGYLLEDGGVVSLRFENRLAGYPGWFWTVSVAVVEDAEPTVLEVELLPGDGALLAPDWVPWAVRLAEYQAAQAAAVDAAGESDDDSDEDDLDELDDEDDLDDDEEDEDDDLVDAESLLHAGDVDGVDIDELDDSDEDDDLDEDDSDEDDSDEDDSDDDEDSDDDSDETED